MLKRFLVDDGLRHKLNRFIGLVFRGIALGICIKIDRIQILRIGGIPFKSQTNTSKARYLEIASNRNERDGWLTGIYAFGQVLNIEPVNSLTRHMPKGHEVNGRCDKTVGSSYPATHFVRFAVLTKS